MHRNLVLALACAGVGATTSGHLNERDESSFADASAIQTLTGEAATAWTGATPTAYLSSLSSQSTIPVAASSAATAHVPQNPASSPDNTPNDSLDAALGEAAVAAGVGPADIEHLQSYAEVCFPNTTSEEPDFNAPCNVYAAIEAQCLLGPSGLELLTRPSLEGITNLLQGGALPQTIGPVAQRACVCQSQYLDSVAGCNACSVRMSVYSQEYADRYESLVASTMDEYCRVDNTPSKLFLELVAEAVMADPAQWLDTQLSTTSSVGTATDVSLYYTMSVPGSSAYSIPFPTPGNDSYQTFTSLRTSGGYIIPTATAASAEPTQAADGGDGEDGAAEFEGGAARAATVGIQAIGVFGFVALTALL